MQILCTSLESKTKQVQGADLSIMTALTLTNPGAKSLFDLGVRSKPRSETTRGMIAAFDSMLDGTISLNALGKRPAASTHFLRKRPAGAKELLNGRKSY